MNKEQLKQVLTTVIPKLIESEKSFVKHEWEEFVEKLSRSNDPELRNIGLHENAAIMSKKKISKAIMH